MVPWSLIGIRTHLKVRRTFIPHALSLWNDIGDSMFHGVGLAGFKSRANAPLLA